MFATKDTKQQSGTLTFASTIRHNHHGTVQRTEPSLDSLQLLQRSLGNHYLQTLSLTAGQPDGLLVKRACACGGSCASCMQRQDERRMLLQPKLVVGAPNDQYEQEAERIAEAVANSSPVIQPVTAPGANVTVQRQPEEKPRDQPTTFPVEEQPKVGKEKEDAEKEKLKEGALKAANELGKLLWEGFSTSQIGMHILAQNEHDWGAIIKFVKDFADTSVGKIVLGTTAGGAVTGAFLGARSARDEVSLPSPFSGSAPALPIPKDEKFFKLELKWDFISPPAGITIQTPWLDLPEIGGESSSSTATTRSIAPQFVFRPMQRIPNICTPSNPDGDWGEAAARSARIYAWLLWKQQQDADMINRLLRKNIGQPIGPFRREVTPLFRPTVRSSPHPNYVLFKHADNAVEVANPQAIEAGLRSSAQSLDPVTQADMEMRFEHDFSRVRVHTDQTADQSARAVNALAYTVGTHMVFRTGQYAPQTNTGRRLLAHELTHVVQQTGSKTRSESLNTSTKHTAKSKDAQVGHAIFNQQPLKVSPNTQQAIGYDFFVNRAPLNKARTVGEEILKFSKEILRHHKPKEAKSAAREDEKCEEFHGGSTFCETDEQTGTPTGKVAARIFETNLCIKPCAEQHEAIHINQLKTLCPKVRDCYLAADRGKQPIMECFKMAISGTNERECEAYKVSVPCLEDRLESAKECQSTENKDYGTRKLASDKCFRNKYCEGSGRR